MNEELWMLCNVTNTITIQRKVLTVSFKKQSNYNDKKNPIHTSYILFSARLWEQPSWLRNVVAQKFSFTTDTNMIAKNLKSYLKLKDRIGFEHTEDNLFSLVSSLQ